MQIDQYTVIFELQTFQSQCLYILENQHKYRYTAPLTNQWITKQVYITLFRHSVLLLTHSLWLFLFIVYLVSLFLIFFHLHIFELHRCISALNALLKCHVLLAYNMCDVKCKLQEFNEKQFNGKYLYSYR